MNFQKRGEPPVRSFDERLDLLAKVAVEVGLGLKAGQEVVMTAPLEALPLVRNITRHAYRAGAALVTTLFSDEEATLLRFREARDASFDKATGWLFDGMATAFRAGAARLAIVGENPALLAKQDPAKVARANRARSQAYQPALELIAGFDINWTIASFATPAWAKAVFPGDPEELAVAELWHGIFAASRIDTADPVADWQAHNRDLKARSDHLNGKSYAALHFRGPGTDLVVGLADDHVWAGGATTAKNGIVCNPNIPSEEVFTTPHKDRVEGHVTSTKPLSYQGTLIEEIAVSFAKGAIVEARAKTGGRGPQQGARYRRGRPPPRRGRPGAALLADRGERASLLQHPLRRERRQPHRPRPGLLEMHPERRPAERAGARGARHQPQPHPHRLDDRLGRRRRRRRPPRRRRRAADAQGGMGVLKKRATGR